MYNVLLLSHSYIRYFILILLVFVIVRSLMGWLGNKPFTNLDNKTGLYLLIFTHLQLMAGLVLYFLSPFVKFGPDTMSDKVTRYWSMEHTLAMLIAVALITIARSSSKRMAGDTARFKRLFIFNLMALVIILGTIYMGGRGILLPFRT
jgi:hypothetical protein